MDHHFCPVGHILFNRLRGKRRCPKCSISYELKVMRELGLSNSDIIKELNPDDIDRLFEELKIETKKFS